jgi:hypothetical protein
MKQLIVSTALVAVVTACSAAGSQTATSSAPVHPGTITPLHSATIMPQSAKSGAVASTGTVTIGSKDPVVGVNLYAVYDYSAAEASTDGIRTLAYIKNDLHANAVDLVWNMYATSDSSDSVITKSADTLTASDIAILTRIAQQDGLLVEYRPMMFVENVDNRWEGKIEPASPDAWFNSYYQENLPYLQMAQKYHINEYVIGTEMNKLSPDPQWASFLARSATVFTGEISYTADDNIYFPPDTQLPPTQLTGVDMYEKLHLPASASLSSVVSAYEQFFAGVPASLLNRTAIQETGIEARAGAYGNPPNLGTQGQLDEAVQYNWFIAGCETVKRFHLRGIFFWKVDLADYPVSHPAPSLSTFEGKSGAAAISECASIIKG